MDFIEKLEALSKKIEQVSGSLNTEEATKNALIMPFLHNALGYDVFDPNEVIPEFTADVGTKKGEKVDYALLKDGKVQILVECKKFGQPLTSAHEGQLFRYFSVTNARLAILTNGAVYQFYTDLDAPNKMDETPFLTLDLTDIDEHLVPEIKKITKSTFDIESIVSAAGELKYLSAIKKIIESQFDCPEEDFVRFFAVRVYSGVLTAKVRSQFLDITAKALKQFLNDSINERLKSAIEPQVESEPEEGSITEIIIDGFSFPVQYDNPKIVTTQDEIEGFKIVKDILLEKVNVDRITPRDTESYFGIYLDNTNRKTICRLRFNGKQKYLCLFDKNKIETKFPIAEVNEIKDYREQILIALNYFIEPAMDAKV